MIRATAPGAVTTAMRRAARFDRTMVAFDGGLIAAIPVVAVLGGGIAGGDPVAGVTMGAGAMLIGIAWRTRGGRPPLALMAIDAVVMALSTFLGCLTGATTWLHLIVLAVWSLFGGLLIALGPGGGVLGTQAVLAALVFGRFSEPAGAALGIAGLVLAGGLAQVIFVALFRWPSSLRRQRVATATAYRALAELAATAATASTLPAASALDEAQATLTAPALLGDPALLTLRSLVNEGQRIRVQIAAIQSLLHQHGGAEAIEPILGSAAAELQLDAAAIEGDRGALERLRDRSDPPRSPRPARGATAAETIAPAVARRLAGLAGQLRAVATLAPAAGEGGGLRLRRPVRHASRFAIRRRSYAVALRANASLSSPAGRHALRLAVVVVVAELISRAVPLSRSYWMVVAAATTLRPEFGATFTRGTERVLGTCLGVTLAGAIIVAFHPAGGVTVVLVGLLAWAAYSVFPASFAAGFAFITALVVFLLNTISPDSLATAEARLVDTLVGGAIGLIAYALWPTWGRGSASQSLGDLVVAGRAYFDCVIGPVADGAPLPEERARPLSRAARLARTRAEAAIANSLSEPPGRRIDADQSRGALGAMRRLVQAVHAIRLDAEDAPSRPPVPGLRRLAGAVDELLRVVEETVRAPEAVSVARVPDLRAAYDEWEPLAPDDEYGQALLATLDEIVDAANTLAAVIGLEVG
ncbi:MAG TPA: FUSC family protein [Solirubrobacteraceae bacterium]|jgi:uncharacterized membrane protein YccC|nr:FUSC family protein [Solirubrobacteraceae bacterium]